MNSKQRFVTVELHVPPAYAARCPSPVALDALRKAWRQAQMVQRQITLMRTRPLDDVCWGLAGFAAEGIEKTIHAIEDAASILKVKP